MNSQPGTRIITGEAGGSIRVKKSRRAGGKRGTKGKKEKVPESAKHFNPKVKRPAQMHT